MSALHQRVAGDDVAEAILFSKQESRTANDTGAPYA
jgi:hypothetical protein